MKKLRKYGTEAVIQECSEQFLKLPKKESAVEFVFNKNASHLLRTLL